MKNKLYKIASIALSLSLAINVSAKVNVNATSNTNGDGKLKAGSRATLNGKVQVGDCSAPTNSADLDINNVRAKILTGGDFWWDLSNAKYEIPKGSNRHSLFAGSLWIGGFDQPNSGGNLKVAAMTYRQTGIDFWPGPLNTIQATIGSETCDKYDKIFQITRVEAEEIELTNNIKNWPGNGDLANNEDQFLAPFRDVDNNGIYDPNAGDRPKFYNTEDGSCKNTQGLQRNSYLYGDKALWWVFNDKGNAHGESKSPSGIGLEIRAQAFAFTTDDDINNMTFYQYEIINRAQTDLFDTYIAYWVDPDLGNFNDDIVGCDVARGLGFVYNNDEDDQGAEGYGKLPAALGIDFFQGPKADAKDNVDNNRNGIVDDFTLIQNPTQPGVFDTVYYEEIIMSRFVYYNNNGNAQNGNPGKLTDFYNYMNGIWRDNTLMYYPQNGVGNGTSSASAVVTNFMFSGKTDSSIFGKNGYLEWKDGNTQSAAGDRRFLQSAGKFTLESGAVNYVTTGVVWAQDPNGSRLGSLDIVKKADDKAQLIFDNCFKLLDGPNAPDVTFQELDRRIILYLTNSPRSNNYKENYIEADATLSRPAAFLNYPFDSTFRFEGYKVYQVRRADVTSQELDNTAVARLVYEGDIKNDVTSLVNYNVDKATGTLIGSKRANGFNKGLSKVLVIEKDLFAETANAQLVNDKNYYFVAVAYAQNNFKTYAPNITPVTVTVNGQIRDASNPAFNGQSKPYLQGRNNIKVYITSPFKNAAQFDSNVVKAQFGDGLKISRLQGRGNDGGMLELEQNTIDAILANGLTERLDYKQGKGPLRVKVIDPLNVSNSKYRLEMLPGKLNYTFPWKAVTATQSRFRVPITYEFKDINVFADSSLFKLTITETINGVQKDTTLFSDKFISFNDEFILPSKGISIQIKQNLEPGPNGQYGNYLATSPAEDGLSEFEENNGFIGASITYADPTKQWLGGVSTVNNINSPRYWIKSVTTKFAGVDNNDGMYGIDDELAYTKVLNGTWGPGGLMSMTNSDSSLQTVNSTSLMRHLPNFPFGSLTGATIYNANHSIFQYLRPSNVPTLAKLSSIMLVITKDKAKWTRCPVLNMSDFVFAKTGGKPSRSTQHFSLLRSPSVNKEGLVDAALDPTNPENSGFVESFGMGWFPGYAINTETGERLNMMFGEDSTNATDNGNDMKWNPTNRIVANVNGNPDYQAWGGRHYVYILGANATGSGATPKYKDDFGLTAHKAMRKLIYNLAGLNSSILSSGHWGGVPAGARPEIPNLLRDLMWVNVPLTNTGQEFLASDVTININVRKPFSQGFSLTNYPDPNTALNQGYPVYEFDTKDIATNRDAIKNIANALDYVNVVPNPYFAYSAYETSQIDNRVKITNLPERCEVSIYNPSGTLIRKYNKENSNRITNPNDKSLTLRNNYIDWDIKNNNGIPIAGGMYIIYIKDLNTGKEKTIKWLGVLRPTDLDNF